MSNYKISDATRKQLRRMPDRYRIIAEQVLKNEVCDAVDVTADSIMLAWSIVLIEHQGYGTNTRRPDSRLKKCYDEVQAIIDFSAKRYGDAMAEALRKRLHDLGIDYESDRRVNHD